VDVICRIVGVPLKDEPLFHAWIADVMAGIFDVGRRSKPKRVSAAGKMIRASALELAKYMIGLVEEAAAKPPGPKMISQMVHDDGPHGPMSAASVHRCRWHPGLRTGEGNSPTRLPEVIDVALDRLSAPRRGPGRVG
jgi:hypothetical protein